MYNFDRLWYLKHFWYVNNVYYLCAHWKWERMRDRERIGVSKRKTQVSIRFIRRTWMLLNLFPLMEHLLTEYFTAGTKTLRTSHINLKMRQTKTDNVTVHIHLSVVRTSYGCVEAILLHINTHELPGYIRVIKKLT